MSSQLSELHPAFQPYARAILEALRRLSPSFVVTSALRSYSAQKRLYDAYTAGKRALTVAPPGCSKHQLGLAVDIARAAVDPKEDPLLHAVGRAWRSMGGEWGGDADPVHFGLPGKLCPPR